MNLEEEVRDGYRISKGMKSVWAVQLEMLNYLLRVCQKYNLKIWAEGGTLLGTIRHNGYIPWDDDIDMMMLREDYDKLISVAPKEFKYPYFLQSAATEKRYIRGHAQLRKSGTSAILKGDKWQNFHQGIFIDIFVFDKLPILTERDKIFKDLENKRRVMNNYMYSTFLSRYAIEYLISSYKILFAGGLSKYFNKFESLIIKCKNKSKSEIGDVLWTSRNYRKYMRDEDWFKETIMMPFEDMMMPVPYGYDNILKTQYGDYMKPVKAPSMHGNVIFSITEDYKVGLRNLRKEASLKEKLAHPIKFLSSALL